MKNAQGTEGSLVFLASAPSAVAFTDPKILSMGSAFSPQVTLFLLGCSHLRSEKFRIKQGPRLIRLS